MADLPAGATPKNILGASFRGKHCLPVYGWPNSDLRFPLRKFPRQSETNRTEHGRSGRKWRPGASYANTGGGPLALSGESQAGTGRFLDARNDGLKSLDW